MTTRVRVAVILLALLVVIALVVSYNWNLDRKDPLHPPAATLVVTPASFSLVEGHNITLSLSFISETGQPIIADVTWEIATSGEI